MDYQEIIKKIRPELDKVINFFQNELQKIRSSRPSSTLIEEITVDCFGKKVPLKNLAMISVLGPREFRVQPWDKIYFEPIEKAIHQSPIGMTPVAEKDSIRISFPPLSEDFRKDLISLLGKKTDEAKRTIRHWRDKASREIQDGFLRGEISEDDKYRAKDKLQELIDEYNEKIDESRKQKEKEVLQE